jgi:hypothetical protein
VKTGTPGSTSGTCQTTETAAAKSVSVRDGAVKASGHSGCTTDGDVSRVVSLVTSLMSFWLKEIMGFL